MVSKTYLFQSQRLGFRNWLPEDIAPMAAMNADPKVMEHFPGLQSQQQTIEFIERMQGQLADKGFCYFAVDQFINQEFIGFIGLSWQIFEASFTPCIDIGWRLKTSAWHQGFATEGAKRCLDYAFRELGLQHINAIAPKVNLRSIQVMKNIGMEKAGEFKHPRLIGDTRLEDCVLFQIAAS